MNDDDVVIAAFLDAAVPAGATRWDFRLPDEDLRRSPEWNPAKGRVPLPVEVAVQKATQVIQKVPIDVGLNLSQFNSGYRWAGPNQIELLRTGLAANNKPLRDVWFYKVHFKAFSHLSGSGMTPRGEVVVLMTGKTFLPQPRKRL
jgi:hypothetical protein